VDYMDYVSCGTEKDRVTATRQGARALFRDDVLAKTEARMVVARSSGSGTLSGLRKRDSPPKLSERVDSR